MILELPAAKFNPWEQDLIKDSVDLEIECPGKSFFVHKVILLAKGLFFEKLKSSTASTKVSDQSGQSTLRLAEVQAETYAEPHQTR